MTGLCRPPENRNIKHPVESMIVPLMAVSSVQERQPSSARRWRPLVHVGLGAILTIALISFGALPFHLLSQGGVNFLAILILGSVLGISAWTLWVTREHNLRAEAAEGELEQIISLSLDLLCVISLDGRFRRTNPAFLNVLGQKPDNLIEKSITDIVIPEDIHIVVAQLKSLAQGWPTSFEVRCRCGDGTHKWMSWSANPIPARKLIYAVAHDISGRKGIEDALRAESAFRRAMEESVSTGLQAMDMKGRIIYVNRAFCDMVGVQPEKLIGTDPPFSYWPRDDMQLHWQYLARSLSGQAPKDGFEVRIQNKDGRLFDVRWTISPLIDNLGVQTGWMSSMADITDSRRARAQLEAAYDRFTAVLDGLDAAVSVLDLKSGELLYANRAFHDDDAGHQVGHNALDVLADRHPGTPDVDLAQLRPEDLPRELFDGELHHEPSNRWYHLRERATRWVDGRIVRLIVATDITELKQIEDLNREQEARLARTSRLVTMGEMASTLAHELNQPLSAIANYSKGCVNRLQSGSYRHEDILNAMEKANAQAARAGLIVRRVRDFVRKSEPKRSAVSLAEITEDALGIAEIEARRLNVRIDAGIAADLPAVYADRIQVEQVMLNLIKNAAEAENGQPTERRVVELRAEVKDDMMEVSVTDYGHGIADKDREHLFSAFFTTKQEGMGMGLNICRSIIEFHNGRLWVDPNPAGGCIFRFTLPLETHLEQQPVDA